MNNIGYEFWKRIDLKRKETLKTICEQNGLIYQRIADQRSDNRLPKLEDAFALSQSLGVSLEYLLTGSESLNISKEAREVENSLELRALVRAIIRDRTLLQIISAVIESDEKSLGKEEKTG